MNHKKLTHQSGFTILELMIATVVLSVILLLVTSVMIGIQALYYKGVNQENVQNNVRSIVNEVSQEIQDNNLTVQPVALPYWVTVKSVPYQEKALCIGSVRYLYVMGAQVGSETAQALWRDSTPVTGCGTNGTAFSVAPNIINHTPADNGTEYVASGARLTDFQVTSPTGSNPNYVISVAVAIGNDGLLNLNNNATNNDYGAQCISNPGDQFCATASLTTEVGQRIQ